MSHPGLSKLDELCVNTIRFLALDAVEKAKSGHPGMPMGMAPAAYTLWMRHLKFNPADPQWHNRDRFVLSGGHGSMLLYSLLYLTGYNLTLEDLQQFRQWESKTPGHPEYDLELGIEATTGPLGQGISNAVGMAIAQKYLANYFNREGFPVVDYKIYVFVGDGDLQEGIASETCSLAGHLGLDNLVVVYDDNHISIDGPTELSFTEDRAKRFDAYGWYVQKVAGDGNDMKRFERALIKAKSEVGRPSIIQLRTHIAYGSPNMQDTAKAHGSPLGEQEIRLTKQALGWDPDKHFHVPPQVLDNMRKAIERGTQAQNEWNDLFRRYGEQHPDLAKEFTVAAEGHLPIKLDGILPKFEAGGKPIATREASGKVLDALMPKLPMVLGGSADLTPSNNTRFAGVTDFQKDARLGRYIRYGVREHGMGAIMNGISLSRLLRAYGGTFLAFSDYMRGAVRVAALSKYPSIFVFTHDSIGLGEDGPTHQPVEHFAALRAIPELVVIRPADANETAYAWKYILENRDRPVALLLSRQGMPILDQNRYASAVNLVRGAYVLTSSGNPQVILLASGSEVALALDAAQKLEAQGVTSQVVSMPCWSLFEKQDERYRHSVLPPHVKARVAVEAATDFGWHKWLGEHGAFVGLCRFGASAPYKACYDGFGVTSDNIVRAAKEVLQKLKTQEP
jgi:transketolase